MIVWMLVLRNCVLGCTLFENFSLFDMNVNGSAGPCEGYIFDGSLVHRGKERMRVCLLSPSLNTASFFPILPPQRPNSFSSNMQDVLISFLLRITLFLSLLACYTGAFCFSGQCYVRDSYFLNLSQIEFLLIDCTESVYFIGFHPEGLESFCSSA